MGRNPSWLDKHYTTITKTTDSEEFKNLKHHPPTTTTLRVYPWEISVKLSTFRFFLSRHQMNFLCSIHWLWFWQFSCPFFRPCPRHTNLRSRCSLGRPCGWQCAPGLPLRYAGRRLVLDQVVQGAQGVLQIHVEGESGQESFQSRWNECGCEWPFFCLL